MTVSPISRPTPAGGVAARRAAGRSVRRRWLWIGVVLVAGAGAVYATLPGRASISLWRGRADREAITHIVEPVVLHVVLSEEGELAAVNSVEIKNEVQAGNVKIEWVIEESTRVKKGDLVIRLSADDLKDRAENEALELRKIAAQADQYGQDLAITLSDNATRLRKAEIDLQVAELELKRYLEGEMSKSLTTVQLDIESTRRERQRKLSELEESRPLVEKGFVMRSRIEDLEFELSQLEMKLQKNELEKRILEEYEFVKNRMQKESAVNQAREELEREKERAKSREEQARSRVKDQRDLLTIRESRYERLKEQLAKCELTAPVDGVVQYGGEERGWRSNRIAAGEQVYPGQTLLTIPDTSKMKVKTRIHEADRHKIREGLACTIKVPAVPGREFTGKLLKIAQFADSERSWLNPNLKEHAAEIELADTDAPVSPGDTAHIEIHIEEVPDALAVPVQCVFTRGPLHFVFVRGTLGTKPVEVKLGRTTTTMAEITSGLSAGDCVVMAPGDRLLAMLPSAAGEGGPAGNKAGDAVAGGRAAKGEVASGEGSPRSSSRGEKTARLGGGAPPSTSTQNAGPPRPVSTMPTAAPPATPSAGKTAVSAVAPAAPTR